ncbi:hypothetical protein Tco_1539263 [Tanacetum coccineum]
MEISIADQIALDDALVASIDRLKIDKCNLRLSSDVSSKEATPQVVYDVLKLTPFYKAFQVTADAPEIYMQEFWASSFIVYNRSVRFKMNNNFNTDIANHTSSKKDQIDNLLKERRLMRSLEKFGGGRCQNLVIKDLVNNKVRLNGDIRSAFHILRIIPVIVPEHQVKFNHMKMEILLEPTSNKLMVDPHGFKGLFLKFDGGGPWFQLSHKIH